LFKNAIDVWPFFTDILRNFMAGITPVGTQLRNQSGIKKVHLRSDWQISNLFSLFEFISESGRVSQSDPGFARVNGQLQHN
jgi:hypothetical protein